MSKVQFGSKIGLIAATVGSAVGLGNIWRFPAEAQANGGAAFLLVYIGCVFLLGVPVMLTEFAVGRGGGSDAIGSLKNLGAAKPWWVVGALGILASYLILCFYMVVAGWTFEYLIQSLTGNLFDGVAGEAGLNGRFTAHMQEYVTEPWPPLVNTFIMIAINLGILIMGVQKGIERMSNVLMPLLFVLLLIFCSVAMTLPKASEGLQFFFNPDFSKITPKVALNALGQAFFSLSLGMGILITYSSYFPKKTKLGTTAVTVSLLDLLVAVLMGVIIFPAVMSFNLQGEGLEGSTLVFVTLPEVFAMMPFTQFWSILFFTLLLVAALTSTVSIAEVSIRFLQDRFRMGRVKACLVVLMPLFVLSSVCSLSNGVWSGFKVFGLTIFGLFDAFSSNILLPLSSLLLCVWMGWFSKRGFFRSELSNDGTLYSRLYDVVTFIVRWLAPVLILIVFISNFL